MPEMAGNGKNGWIGWNWLKMAENCGKWSKMAGMAGNS